MNKPKAIQKEVIIMTKEQVIKIRESIRALKTNMPMFIETDNMMLHWDEKQHAIVWDDENELLWGIVPSRNIECLDKRCPLELIIAGYDIIQYIGCYFTDELLDEVGKIDVINLTDKQKANIRARMVPTERQMLSDIMTKPQREFLQKEHDFEKTQYDLDHNVLK